MAKKKTNKIFVLDTNVILHDSSCIHQFAEHDLVIPITVLEELDNFKKGNDILNFHAREFARSLDSLSEDRLFNGGMTIGPGLGTISIRLEREYHPDIARNFTGSKPDHHILNAAYCLAKEMPLRQVVLVSKDVNLRMKAKSMGMAAEDYTTDRVSDISALYKGIRFEVNLSAKIVDQLYREPFEVDAAAADLTQALLPNENIVLRSAQKSALATFKADRNTIVRVEKVPAYGITPRNAEQCFALNMLMDDTVRLVSLTGKAGTGKTLLAIAAALEKRKNYYQIYVARPIIPLSNKDIGYLPGDIDSKIGPYMQPLHDNLAVIRNQFSQNDRNAKRINEMLDLEKLQITPLAYIRGRSLVKVFFIVDEAQNLTPNEIKTIITRAGEGTKLVFTGDIYQIDHPYLDSHTNGLSYLISKMKGQRLYAHINLEKGERSELAEIAANLL
jgi:PhoH-like ATPase